LFKRRYFLEIASGDKKLAKTKVGSFLKRKNKEGGTLDKLFQIPLNLPFLRGEKMSKRKRGTSPLFHCNNQKQ
jgi:hypothetical protein